MTKYSPSRTFNIVCCCLTMASSLVLYSCSKPVTPAQQVLEKHIAAVGGESALSALTSRNAEGKFLLAGTGYEGTVSDRTIFGESSRVSIAINGKEVAAYGVSDGTAWRFDPMSGAKVLEGKQKSLAIRAVSPDPVWGWRDSFESASIVEEEAEETSVKVLLRSSEGNQAMFVFDKETGLLAQLILFQEESRTTQSYTDYREVNGVQVAHKVLSNQGGQGTIELEFTSLDFNVDLSGEDFSLPEQLRGTPAK